MRQPVVRRRLSGSSLSAPPSRPGCASRPGSHPGLTRLHLCLARISTPAPAVRRERALTSRSSSLHVRKMLGMRDKCYVLRPRRHSSEKQERLTCRVFPTLSVRREMYQLAVRKEKRRIFFFSCTNYGQERRNGCRLQTYSVF